MSDTLAAPRINLGLDLGTSSLKVVAVGSSGLIGEGSAAFATDSTLPGQAEQDPGAWLAAASAAMRALSAEMTVALGADWAKRIDAIGLTGQLPTLVCLGDAQPLAPAIDWLAPAITWKDARADEWVSRRVDPDRRAQMYAHTGMPMDGRYLAPMLQYHFASRLPEIRSMLSAKDFLLFNLTGMRTTEPSTAAGYGIYDLHQRRFSEELAEFWRVPSTILPPIKPSNTLAGPLSAVGAALLGLPAGIPVSTGAADSVCASYTMAGLDENVISISFGSSAVVIGACAAPRLDATARCLVTPHVVEGWFGREMDLLATGTGYRWLSDLFSWLDGELDRHAARSPPGAHGLFFPPYLAGAEQGALWNPRLKGAILGLGLRHTSSDIARSFLEGVFFEIKRCVEVLTDTIPVQSIMVSGNIVHSAGSMQMLADILKRPIGAVRTKSPAAIGAAVLARRLSPAASSAVPRDSAATRAVAFTQPDPAASRVYDALYRQYVAQAARCE